MSDNAPDPGQKPDKRTQRTRERLGDALIGLVLEKPFDDITVQDVLDRAEVARSTFYQHFKDKDDLLLGDADDFFSEVATRLTREREASDRVLPVREFLEHLKEAQAFLAALSSSGRYQDVMDLGQAHFARGIEQRLAASPRAAGIDEAQRPVMAHALAGSFMALMGYWLARGMTDTPADLDAMFHRMVWSGVGPRGGWVAP